ncbi:MAG: radical SAM protein [Deltaproteobacteria bacterium]|nr:radical SAM protein [Deltaproteobacteria bacterium]MBW1849231.1 radical SAM protein [Deltaproteobacteria bacterium]
MIAYGPVPSRRLGRSMGINNIPPTICSYSCVYCQLGFSKKRQVDRMAFYEPKKVLKAVRDKVQKVKQHGETIDYLTIVSDGEPTLDINLGHEIELLKSLGLKIAVITNASLIWREDVREELLTADWVSLKMDSMTVKAWRRVNRPHGTLNLQAILNGALEFAKRYRGKLTTETMLVKGVNDTDTSIREVADFLARLKPATIYLAIPTKPPAEGWVESPGEKAINRAFQILSKRMDQVEYLIGYEGNAFAFTGNAEEDLLSITAVHPMRREAVSDFLVRAKVDWKFIEDLIAQGKLIETKFDGHTFYMPKLQDMNNQRST